MLTDQELQSLRNMGNEAEAAADEIQRLRNEVHELQQGAKLTTEVETLRAALRDVLRGDEGLTGSEYGALIERAERLARVA